MTDDDDIQEYARPCPNCEYHRKRAQLWRDEAYKQSGHPLPEREPVAWIKPKELLVMQGNAYAGVKDWRVNLGLEPEEGDVALYTSPPRRTWVGLTDKEIEAIWKIAMFTDYGVGAELSNQPFVHYARAIEAKLKEKNS